jgi:DNA-binding transcriptional ArsR family regulator
MLVLMELTSITPSPAGLKALSHPVRLRMLGLLRTEGPATSTTHARRLGLNTGATSYHLRQLAQHGFVVDDEGRGNARERWWKAAHQATTTTTTVDDPAEQEVVDAYLQSVAIVHTERLQRAVEQRGSVPREWLEASTLSDWELRLTASRARELTDAISALVQGWDEDEVAEDAAEFVVQVGAFPLPDHLAGPREPEAER